MTPEAAYEHVIQTLECATKVLSEQDAALNKDLHDAGESEAYIKSRLDAYAIEIEKHVRLTQAVRQLKQDGWTP